MVAASRDEKIRSVVTFETIVTIEMVADNEWQRLRNGLIGLNGLSYRP